MENLFWIFLFLVVPALIERYKRKQAAEKAKQLERQPHSEEIEPPEPEDVQVDLGDVLRRLKEDVLGQEPEPEEVAAFEEPVFIEPIPGPVEEQEDPSPPAVVSVRPRLRRRPVKPPSGPDWRRAFIHSQILAQPRAVAAWSPPDNSGEA